MGVGKFYDFPRAKLFIEDEINKEGENFDSASMGMRNDWFWTGVKVHDGKLFLKDLTEPNLELAGLTGSYRDTPIVRVYYKDGKSKDADCFKEGNGEV